MLVKQLKLFPFFAMLVEGYMYVTPFVTSLKVRIPNN